MFESFDDLPDSYRAALDEAVGDADFFATLAWFRLLSDSALDPVQKLRVYGAESPCMVLPMCQTGPSTGFFEGGRRLTALANFYSPVFRPLLAQAGLQVEQFLNRVVETIVNERPRWDTVDLHPLDVGSAEFKHLLLAFQRVGMPVQRYLCFGNWYLPVNGRSYQAYFESLPSRLKNTLTRKSRQLERDGRLRIEIVSDGPDLEKGIAAYEEIYRSSWKPPEDFPLFIPGLVRLCAEQGCLRLGIGYVDDRPAAAQIWIVHNGVASIYKLAYDDQFSKFSVGTILTGRLMHHVIDIDRVHEVDFLSGDDAYKTDWMSERRERWGMVAFNLRTIRGAFSAARHIGGRSVKGLFSTKG